MSMKRKIFGSKDSQSGFRSYLKFLLWAAIGLIVLVLFIPLTSRQKSGKEALKRPVSERGVVVKEIPRSLQTNAENTRGQGGSGDAPKEADAKPAATPDGKSPTDGTGTPHPAVIKEKPVDAAAVPQKTETGSEVTKKDLPGQPAPSESASASQVHKEVQAVPKAGDVTVKETPVAPSRNPEATTSPPPETQAKAAASRSAPAKPAKPSAAEAKPGAGPAAATPDAHKQASADGGKMYTVQVATLKDKQSAEELKKTLQNKGFAVVMKTANDPKQGQSYTLQLQPVDNMSKASTLMEQVKYVPKAKPAIVPVNKE
jgi:cell division septation protein DedD